MTRDSASPAQFDPVKLKLYRGLLTGLLVLFTGGALSIPFVYESQTIWYKIGIDKTMLRAGQLAGLVTAVLLFVQVLLASRGKVLVDLFGIAALMRWHKTNGLVISCFALCHALLLLAPEGMTNLPIGGKYWPEMVGVLLLGIILSMAISSQFRQQLQLDYRRWRAVHRWLGYLVIPIIGVHVLFVSDSFERTVPRAALLLTLTAVVLAVILSRMPARAVKRQA